MGYRNRSRRGLMEYTTIGYDRYVQYIQYILIWVIYVYIYIYIFINGDYPRYIGYITIRSITMIYRIYNYDIQHHRIYNYMVDISSIYIYIY